MNGRVESSLISVSCNCNNATRYGDFSKKIPIVFFDRLIKGLQTINIITDDYGSVFNATEHLIECGCRVVFLSYGQKISY